MSLTTRPYDYNNNNGRAGGLRRVDGPAPSQASITLNLGLDPVPSIPKSGLNGHYPKGCHGTASASTVFRDDLLFTKVTNQNVLTSAGVTTHGCKASMGNEAKPLEGKEDDWCAQWMFMGLAKNNETNPEDGNFGATGGFQRANSTMEAVQTAGSHSVKYTGKHPIHAGQLIVFHEPPTNDNYEKRDSRPLPILGPLDWTRIVSNPLHSIDTMMLDMQEHSVLSANSLVDPDAGSNYQGGRCDSCGSWVGTSGLDPTWEHAALQRKRSILTEGAALIAILVKRGYIKILDLGTSWKEACTEKYVSETKRLAEQGGSADEFRRAYEEYAQELADGYEDTLNQEVSYPDQEKYSWCYDIKKKRVRPIHLEKGSNWLEQFVVSRESQRHLGEDDLLKEMLEMEKGLAWLIRALGLGSAPAEEEHSTTVLEILALCCKSCLDPLTVEDSLSPSSELLSAKGIDEEVEETLSSFRRHLESHEIGLASTIFKIQDRVNRRVVGLSMSSVPAGNNQDTPIGTEPVLDFILGVRTI